jgi:hypothetical protein
MPTDTLANPVPENGAPIACERCGSFDAIEFAERILCTDCIALAGCGCAGHGDEEN